MGALGAPVLVAAFCTLMAEPAFADPGSTSVTVVSSGVHAPFTEAGCATIALSTAVTCASVSGVTVGARVTDAAGAVPPGTTVAAVSGPAGSLTLSAPAVLSASGDTFTIQNDPDASFTAGTQ